LRLAFEARHAPGVRGQSLGQHFDGDVAIQLGAGGAVNGAHTSFAELGDDAEVGGQAAV
jgi:hypothetical protein